MITVIPRKIFTETVNGIAPDINGNITLPIDSEPTQNSNNLLTSGTIYTALSGIQESLDFDNAPTENSMNPVTSGGVYVALTEKASLNSPELTGTPTAPTAEKGTNSTQLATTAFVINALSDIVVDAEPIAIANLKSNVGIVEDGDTAIHMISKGQYVIWKDVLYTADAGIGPWTTLAASGGNKNLTAVSNGGLNALNNKTTLVFTPVSGVDGTNLKIAKVNRVVVITGYVTITNLTTGQYNLGKISSNTPLYPVRFLSSVAEHAYDHPDDVACGIIGNDGGVNINSTATGRKTATINACYIV